MVIIYIHILPFFSACTEFYISVGTNSVHKKNRKATRYKL